MALSENIWRKTVLPLKSTIRQLIKNLNETGLQIVLVSDESNTLLGTVTDGDIRRGLLSGLTLHSPTKSVMREKSKVASQDMSSYEVIGLMRANKLRHLPIVDKENRIIGLHFVQEQNTPFARKNPMVIMAGGLGTRLRPLTENCPKPMIPVAGKPMLEHIIDRAKEEGFSHFIISVNYLGQIIEDYFENGTRHGVRIEYLKESTPLGTAGALALLKPRPEIPFVVTNGDILSDIKYGDLLDFHNRYSAVATMAVRQHEWQHPFGVVRTQGLKIVGFEEKPITRTHINAGVYVISPQVLDVMSENTYCDMPALFEHLRWQRTVAYPMHEPWLDVGRLDDLIQANSEIRQ
jgi:dTDP-glucose pyrophosphorylase